MELQPILFWILAAMTGGSAIAVVVSQNIVRAATWLLFALAGTSGIFFLVGADFVGSAQLFVYVGGTLVLVVFGVMLTAQGPFITMKASAAEWVIATLVGLTLFSVLTISILTRPVPAAEKPSMPSQPNQSASSTVLGEALLGFDQATPPAQMTGFPEGQKAPVRTRVSYLLPFEIVSVHLLVVLIGAAYLARAKRRRRAAA